MTRLFRALATLLLVFARPAAPPIRTRISPSRYFKKYFARVVTKVELEPPVQLEDYVVEAQLELSVKSYLDLVMANNPNISIQRLTVAISNDAITRGLGHLRSAATASFRRRARFPAPPPRSTGAATLNTLSQPLNFGVQQTAADRRAVQRQLFRISKPHQQRSSRPSIRHIIPALIFSFSQPLLRGRGAYITKLPIMIARSR